MSSINPNNINGQYPIAGQDNDSQGFRDNFTNIKNNLSFAKSEIEELQSTAILKTALAGSSLNNDMNYSILSEAKTLKFVDVTNALGTTSANITLDWSTSQYQTVTISGNVTLDFENWAITTGAHAKLVLSVTPDGNNRYITLPAAITGNTASAISGYISESGLDKIKLPSSGKEYLFEFSTIDQGVNVNMRDLLRNYNQVEQGLTVNGTTTLSDGLVTGYQSLSGNANISLTEVTSSISSTVHPNTSFLLDGADGQVKVIAMPIKGSIIANLVVTVSNAAWTGSGTITLDNAGEACMLQYLAGKWVVISNNGATLA